MNGSNLSVSGASENYQLAKLVSYGASCAEVDERIGKATVGPG